MALHKLYEANAATAFHGSDAWSSGHLMFSKRDDGCLFFGNPFNGTYKVFRDGTAIRRVRAWGTAFYSYDVDRDRIIHIGVGSPTINYNIDTMHHIYNPNETPFIQFNASSALFYYGTIFRGEIYKGITAAGTTTVTKKDPVTGTTLGSFQTVATLTPFVSDITVITPEGLCILIDKDNGTYGVLQFYDLWKSQLLYETTIPRAYQVAVDYVNKNIWSVGIVSNRLQIHSFQVEPYAMALAMSSNRQRYNEDTLTATLTGSNNEKVVGWPVGWRLTQPVPGGGFLGDEALGMAPLGSSGQPGGTAEGHLETEYSVTDDLGEAHNTYCGPGAADFVGTSATIQAWTGI